MSTRDADAYLIGLFLLFISFASFIGGREINGIILLLIGVGLFPLVYFLRRRSGPSSDRPDLGWFIRLFGGLGIIGLGGTFLHLGMDALAILVIVIGVGVYAWGQYLHVQGRQR
ncbi:MAG TPA: hypothetical protein VE288_07475 [Rubrobacteraceae bacterium]|nr:hypothetical protein [Rubrobacteraceae bacterium]